AQPIYMRLCRAIRFAVLAHQLRPGDRLPSTRILAIELGVSRNTTESAYLQLENEGLLERRIGDGSYVAQPKQPSLSATIHPAPSAAEGVEGKLPQSTAVRAGHNIDCPAGQARAFDIGTPALDVFPYEQWHKLLTRCSRTVGRDLLGFGD